MKFYQIDTLAADGADAEDFAFVDQGLDELGVGSYMPSQGDPILPELAAPLTLKLGPGSGVRLGTLIGNTHDYLLLAKPAKECIEQACAGVRIEYVPFTLYNHKNRVHSADYFVINPIGAFACIHRQASDIKYFVKPGSPADGKILSIRRLVFDAGKVAAAPPLFRIEGQPRTYIINQALADTFKAKQFTNLELHEIDCA
jgi:hypothetical protein